MREEGREAALQSLYQLSGRVRRKKPLPDIGNK
jgi:hypothetical protein